MNDSTRRQFLQTSAVILATAFAGSSFVIKKNKPLLSFSTLGCPDWPFNKIVNFAEQHHYNGLEIRGLQRQLDLIRCNEFKSPGNRAATMRLMGDKDLKFAGLGSSAALHFADTVERRRNLDEGRLYIDLAQYLECPYVRVFPDNIPKDQDESVTRDFIIEGLLELGDHAKGSGVSVLVESHGGLVKTEDIERIMSSARHAHVGMVWDIANMWTVTKEAPAEVYKKLKKYIRHTHIKDAKMVNGKIQYTLLGRGEIPVFEAIDALSTGGYKGYYSFEWEKLWHHEIAEPEIALADYYKVMKQHFN